jgi:hypothetical protein
MNPFRSAPIAIPTAGATRLGQPLWGPDDEMYAYDNDANYSGVVSRATVRAPRSPTSGGAARPAGPTHLPYNPAEVCVPVWGGNRPSANLGRKMLPEADGRLGVHPYAAAPTSLVGRGFRDDLFGAGEVTLLFVLVVRDAEHAELFCLPRPYSHHDLTAQRVHAAGELGLINGHIHWVSAKSGKYRPTVQNMRNVALHFARHLRPQVLADLPFIVSSGGLWTEISAANLLRATGGP